MVDVVYEDNQILVVVKPQNVPVQLDDSCDKDFLTILKDYLIEKYNKPGKAYLGLVHRLDRPTGGVMVFAKTSKSAERLSKQIRENEVDKYYLAVVDGIPRYKQSRLVNLLKKDEKNNIVKIAPQYEDGAKEAILDYQLLETKNDKSLINIQLETGRSHQIRVQLANIGCPLCNDQKYNPNSKKGNLALWAYKISFNHPVSKKRFTFKVAPPIDVNPWNEFNIEKYI